jgi:hypothetical protein
MPDEKKPTIVNVLSESNIQYWMENYQRYFSWERNQFVEITDSLDYILENRDETGEYMQEDVLGAIKIKRLPIERGEVINRVEVMDGQQRLITVTLFLIALRDADIYANQEEKEKAERFLNTCFFNSSEQPDSEAYFKIRPYDEMDRTILNSLLLKEKVSADYKQNSLIVGLKIFEEKISEMAKTGVDYSDFLAISDNILFDVNIAGPKQDSRRGYGKMNRVKLSLSQGSLIKDVITQNVSNKKFDKIWPLIATPLRNKHFGSPKKTDKDIASAMGDFLATIYGKAIPPLTIDNLLQEHLALSSVNPEKFLDDFAEYSKSWFKYKHDKSSKYLLQESVEVFKSLKIDSADMLVTQIIRSVEREDGNGLSVDEGRKVIAIVESCLFRTSFTNGEPKDFEENWANLAHELEAPQKGKQFPKKVLESISDKFPTEEELKVGFAEALKSKIWKGRGATVAKYICVKMENLHRLPGDWVKIGESHYEHIIAQKKAKKGTENLIYKLGNGILLNGFVNGKLQAKPWEEKRELLKEKSHYAEVKLIENIRDFNGEVVTQREERIFNNLELISPSIKELGKSRDQEKHDEKVEIGIKIRQEQDYNTEENVVPLFSSKEQELERL